MHLNIFIRCRAFHAGHLVLIWYILYTFHDFSTITCVDVRGMIMLVFITLYESLLSYGEMQKLFFRYMIYIGGAHTIYAAYHMHMALKTGKHLKRLTGVENTPPWFTWRWWVSKFDGIYTPLSMDWSVATGILWNQKDFLTSGSPKHISILYIIASSKDYLCWIQIKIGHLVWIVQHIMAKIK